MTGDSRVTRRAVLLGAVAIPVAACRPKRRAVQRQAQSADRLAVAAAVAAEHALLAEYDARARPGEAPDEVVVAARAAHAEHIRALGGQLVARPTSPHLTARPTADLSRLERQSARRLRQAATSASSGAVAAVLASVAASHDVFGQTRQVGGA